jgi:hypothetical protein
MNTDSLDAYRDRWAARAWVLHAAHRGQINQRTGRILLCLLGIRPDDRRWRSTALEYIAAAGHEIRRGEPA